eukprot:8661558-Pyramimonas_sp.AAC.1
MVPRAPLAASPRDWVCIAEHGLLLAPRHPVLAVHVAGYVGGLAQTTVSKLSGMPPIGNLEGAQVVDAHLPRTPHIWILEAHLPLLDEHVAMAGLVRPAAAQGARSAQGRQVPEQVGGLLEVLLE